MTGGTGRTDRGATTRQRLIDAGVALMASVQVSDLLPGVRAVCRQAGMPTGSFYHCFGDATAFHMALVERLIDQPPSTARVERYTANVERIMAEGESGAEVAARVATNGGEGLEHTLSELRDATRAQQLLAAVADRDDVVAAATRQAYGERIERTSSRHRAAMETFLETLGCSIRPPFTVRSVVDVLAAMADGLVMRAQLEPGFDAATLLEDTVRVIFVALLQGDHDELDLDDLLALVADAAGVPA